MKRFISILLVLIFTFCFVISASAQEYTNLGKNLKGRYLVCVNTSTDTNKIVNVNIPPKYNEQLSQMLENTGNTPQSDEPVVIHPRIKYKYVRENTTAAKYSVKVNAAYAVNNTKNFTVYDIAQNTEYIQTQKVMAVGSHCTVWFPSSGASKLTTTHAQAIAKEFDNNIYPKVSGTFGTWTDKDKDGKLAIVCYDIRDEYYYDSNSPGYIAGYFSPSDLLSKSEMSDSNSNNMDMINIDINPLMNYNSTVKPLACLGTLAHEFEHLINYSAYYKGNKQAETDLWLDESMAQGAANLCVPEEMDSEIYVYNNDSYKYLRNGLSLMDWYGYLENYALGSFFAEYLYRQTKDLSGGGTNIFKYIMQSKYGDYRSVQEAIRKFFPNMSFAELYFNYRVALVAGEDTGKFSFYGNTALNNLKVHASVGGEKEFSGGQTRVYMIGGVLETPTYANMSFAGVYDKQNFVSSTKYGIDGSLIYKVPQNTTQEQLFKDLQFVREPIKMLRPQEIMKTGFSFYVETNNQYTVVVDSDLNGDGITTSADYVPLRKHLLGIEQDPIYDYAGDSNNDNQVTATDVAHMRKKVLGLVS